MQEAGGGVLLYLAQEGRGIGLANKMRAYRLQQDGFDTVDANERLGFVDDERSFLAAGRMLDLLGVQSIRLLTNNPRKVAALEAIGVHVTERVPLVMSANPHNAGYLKAKAKRSGHLM
jgi:GTP cyclohydrolase II